MIFSIARPHLKNLNLCRLIFEETFSVVPFAINNAMNDYLLCRVINNVKNNIILYKKRLKPLPRKIQILKQRIAEGQERQIRHGIKR